MRYVDAFCHFFPKKTFELLLGSATVPAGLKARMQATRGLYDLDARFHMMDGFEDYMQILSLGLPGLEGMAGPNESPDCARTANEELANLVARHPDRFAGYVGALPLNAPEEAAREAERILINGTANGVQLHTTVNGLCLDDARFLPIFDIAQQAGKPILLHPSRSPTLPDFQAEARSRYEIWTIFGWPYETSVTMARLIFSGVMSRFPKLKAMVHHFGGLVPMCDARIDVAWPSLAVNGSRDDYGDGLQGLGKPLLEYFRQFYADTALCGSRAATACGLEFFGVDHVLFATDAPFGPQEGATFVRATIEVLEALDIPRADQAKIFHRNAESFFLLDNFAAHA
jgi:predicted TIM-barrel fold metal-dependent hydrolase